MKNWESTETRLRSWHLRQPSARIEQALFGAPAPSGEPARRHVHWQGGWAAGLATCAIVVLTVLNLAHLNGISASPGLIISNTTYAASFAAVQHNCVSAPIFGWTNDGELHSSNRSFDLYNTNLLH